jgi:hypothetical protein
MKEIKNWKDEYCNKFGLCKKGEKCQCKEEVAFISKVIQKEKEKVEFENIKLVQDTLKADIVGWLERNWERSKNWHPNEKTIRIKDLIFLLKNEKRN